MPNVEDILKERQATHGSFRAHAGLSQSLKDCVCEAPGFDNLTDTQREAISMILHKIARAVVGNANYVDHWDDIQGYAKLVSDILREDNAAELDQFSAALAGLSPDDIGDI